MAVRLDDHSFFKSLQRLKQEVGITGKDRVTVMSNSVAVGLDGDSVFKSLQRPKQELGITGKDLVTFMGVPWRSDWMRTASSSRCDGWIRSSASPAGPGHVR